MGRVRLSLVVCLAFVISAVNRMAKEDRVNQSAPGLFWPSSGFFSLDGMLQWAIGHSNPTKLKETAQSMQRLSPDELRQRQTEIKELMEKLKMPSDEQLMHIAIDDLNNSSISLEGHLRALEELLVLVEPIDNANGLEKLGGVAAVVRQLDNVEPDVRKLAAWVLGKASQNNQRVQYQILDLGALTKLINMVRSDFIEEAIKALYAISAIVRYNLYAQKMFFAENGHLILKDILSNSNLNIRLHRKCVLLVSDLAESQVKSPIIAELPFFSGSSFLKAVVDLTSTGDFDLQEKALVAIKNLLLLRTTEASVLQDYCSLDKALERMKLKFQRLLEEDGKKDYARDMEILRREVELVFLKKLEKNSQTQDQGSTQSTLQNVEDVVTSLLAKGFLLGKDVVNKAKSLDEKHRLSSTASTKISSFDQKIGLSEKISMGTNKMKEMDQKYQVSEKTKTAFAAAEEKVRNAGLAMMKNQRVQTGASWASSVFNRVNKAAGELGQRIREVRMAKEEQSSDDGE